MPAHALAHVMHHTCVPAFMPAHALARVMHHTCMPAFMPAHALARVMHHTCMPAFMPAHALAHVMHHTCMPVFLRSLLVSRAMLPPQPSGSTPAAHATVPYHAMSCTQHSTAHTRTYIFQSTYLLHSQQFIPHAVLLPQAQCQLRAQPRHIMHSVPGPVQHLPHTLATDALARLVPLLIRAPASPPPTPPEPLQTV